MNSLGSKLITYKKEKTGRVACNQPGVTSLLGRLLRVAIRGVCSLVFSDTGRYTKLDGINVENRLAFPYNARKTCHYASIRCSPKRAIMLAICYIQIYIHLRSTFKSTYKFAHQNPMEFALPSRTFLISNRRCWRRLTAGPVRGASR